MFPKFLPATPVLKREPFDDPRFIYELKHDGFRALAHITPNECRLISRRGNVYKSYSPLRESLVGLNREVVLDGEIVVFDGIGRPQFYELLRRRGEPAFYAFDVLVRKSGVIPFESARRLSGRSENKSMKHFVPSTIRPKPCWGSLPSNSRWGRILRFLEKFSPPRIVLWAKPKR